MIISHILLFPFLQYTGYPTSITDMPTPSDSTTMPTPSDSTTMPTPSDSTTMPTPSDSTVVPTATSSPSPTETLEPVDCLCHFQGGNSGKKKWKKLCLPPPAVEAHLREHPMDVLIGGTTPDGDVLDDDCKARASCESRTKEKWCLNDFQPYTGDCEWKDDECRPMVTTTTVATTTTAGTTTATKQRASCASRTKEKWCTNDFQPSSGDCEWVDDTDTCRTAGGH